MDYVPDSEINAWISRNPGWTHDQLKVFMASRGVTPEQVARATGTSPEAFVSAYNGAGRLPVQKGAQTAYVDYTQPFSPISEGAGSGNLPYYYGTPKGQVASYLPSAYWRGNAPAYGGMARYAEGGEVKSPTSSQEWLKAKCNG
jgi:hypothetical protein